MKYSCGALSAEMTRSGEPALGKEVAATKSSVFAANGLASAQPALLSFGFQAYNSVLSL